MPLRLAREELGRHAHRMDPRAVGVFLLLAVLLGVVLATQEGIQPSPERDLYTVAVADPLLEPAVADASRLRLVGGDARRLADGEADLLVRFAPGGRGGDLQCVDMRPTRDGTPQVCLRHGSERGLAAAEAYQQALRLWMDRQLAGEADQDAAFPLEITLAYEPRRLIGPAAPDGPPGDGPTGPDDPGGPDGPAGEPDLVEAAAPSGEVRAGLRPGEVEPPFPIRGLLLTFAYVLPAGLLAQVHAAGLHAERTRRRGVLLLSTPLPPWRILLGKSLPALGLALLIGITVTLLLGAGPIGFLASLSFLAFLFAATTLLALMARSPRELTLQQVAVTTLLNTFLFLPAMFPSLPPVAFLSPVHVVAASMRGEAIGLGPFLYATTPLALAAVALSVLSVGFLRHDILYGVRSMPQRFLDALEHVTRGRLRTLLAGMLVVPFVFAAELIVLVTTAVLGLGVAFLLFLPLSVLLETLAKGIPVWARAMRPGASNASRFAVGALVGTGFFLAEKGALVLTLVGFRDLPFGDEALALLGTGPGVLLIMLPLLLHVATAVLLATGIDRRTRVLAFVGAFAVHYGWDLYILRSAL